MEIDKERHAAGSMTCKYNHFVSLGEDLSGEKDDKM